MADQTARRSFIRLLLSQNAGRAQILKMLEEGVSHGGTTYQASRTTVRGDLKAIGAEFSGLFDDKDMVALEMRRIWNSYQAIVKQALKAGKFTPAIQALREQAKILGVASPDSRFSGMASTAGVEGGARPELVVVAHRLGEMTDHELRAHHRQMRARQEELGLSVVEGDR